MQTTTFKLHKYVWGWAAIFAAFAASFPIAMIRVSQTDKFAGQPFNSLTCEGQVPAQRSITQFASCSQLQTSSNLTP